MTVNTQLDKDPFYNKAYKPLDRVEMIVELDKQYPRCGTRMHRGERSVARPEIHSPTTRSINEVMVKRIGSLKILKSLLEFPPTTYNSTIHPLPTSPLLSYNLLRRKPCLKELLASNLLRD